MSEQSPDQPPAHAPTPAELAPPPPPAASDPTASDPTGWGRVAEDGTVFVRTPEGERAVGSYPGATPEEALAYFGHKFDDLAAQVSLLEQRVVAGSVQPGDATVKIAALRETIEETGYAELRPLADLGLKQEQPEGCAVM